MHKKYDKERSIYHAQLWLDEGRYDLALSALQHIQTHNSEQKRQIAYLSAWCHTILEQWTEARCILLHFYPPSSIEENWNNEKHNERERRAFYLLCLGNAAMSLKRFEEASQHYINYQANEDLPDIYYGLCDANRLHGKFEDAYSYGVKALELYEDRGIRGKQGHIQNLLGRICYQMREYNEAAEHYLESLSITTQDDNQEIKLVNFTALADLRLAEERLDEAQCYCEHALEVADGLEDNYSLGLMHLTCGKVTVAESEQATGEQHDILYTKARGFFEKAKELLAQTHDSVLLSEVYSKIALMLEQSGQPQEALSYWKTAYASLVHSTGQSLD
jgi:tetratricopeptide (TPR) repeat protein